VNDRVISNAALHGSICANPSLTLDQTNPSLKLPPQSWDIPYPTTSVLNMLQESAEPLTFLPALAVWALGTGIVPGNQFSCYLIDAVFQPPTIEPRGTTAAFNVEEEGGVGLESPVASLPNAFDGTDSSSMRGVPVDVVLQFSPGLEYLPTDNAIFAFVGRVFTVVFVQAVTVLEDAVTGLAPFVIESLVLLVRIGVFEFLLAVLAIVVPATLHEVFLQTQRGVEISDASLAPIVSRGAGHMVLIRLCVGEGATAFVAIQVFEPHLGSGNREVRQGSFELDCQIVNEGNRGRKVKAQQPGDGSVSQRRRDLTRSSESE